MNGCAFCLRMHTRDAITLGETTDRLAVVAAWWESQYFSAQEQAALALAEEVTNISGPPTRTWDDDALTDEQVSAITWLVIVMNAWNRIAIRSHYPVTP
ncbi:MULTISPECIES: carboxymuconolactone decarboxylase family protein [Kocuria]|uniref:carboxymuconolactone decarboxylase family protein n=1 Tax=Kocuria TaxID=57493 RepID=UPI0021012185|nr:carboxymuconolactone decarboxylase family protein [Kocuria sp. CPCC 104605]